MKISTILVTKCCWVHLFVWSLTSHPRIFHSCGDVTITDEGLQILNKIFFFQELPVISTKFDAKHPCSNEGHSQKGSTCSKNKSSTLKYIFSRTTEPISTEHGHDGVRDRVFASHAGLRGLIFGLYRPKSFKQLMIAPLTNPLQKV